MSSQWTLVSALLPVPCFSPYDAVPPVCLPPKESWAGVEEDSDNHDNHESTRTLEWRAAAALLRECL